ncbi:MAG: IclR family transcriptional regulator [Planctomycetota bacterium]
MVNESEPREGTISSVNHAIDVLEFLSENGAATVTDIAKGTGLPRPTLYRLLRTLSSRRITRSDRKRYLLTLRLHELGVRASGADLLQIRVQPILDHVADEVGLTAHFAVLDGDAAAYIAKRDVAGAIQMTSRVGWRAPLHCTAVGKVLLSAAGIPQGLELTRQTGNTITERGALAGEIERVRQQGFALDDEELLPGLRCVAVPLREGASVIGAVSASGRADQILDPSELAATLLAML